MMSQDSLQNSVTSSREPAMGIQGRPYFYAEFGEPFTNSESTDWVCMFKYMYVSSLTSVRMTAETQSG